jgi:hypothetical protein
VLQLLAFGEVVGEGPAAGEDFCGGAGHVEVVVGLAPFEGEVAAGEVGEDFAVGAAGEDAGDADGAGAGAAGPCDAAAAFPGAHFHLAGGDDLDPVGVDAVGEGLVMLDGGSDAGEIDGIDIGHVDDGVGVAHRDEGHVYQLIRLIERDTVLVLAGAADDFVGIDGNLGQVEDRFAHVDGDLLDLAIGEVQGEGEDSAAGFDGHGVVLGEAVVVGVLGDAADAVAAHLALAAIGVEHAHADIGVVGGEDEDEAIGADAGVAVGDEAGDLAGVGESFLEVVDIDIVVADAVHFGESHGVGFPLVSAGCQQCGVRLKGKRQEAR